MFQVDIPHILHHFYIQKSGPISSSSGSTTVSSTSSSSSSTRNEPRLSCSPSSAVAVASPLPRARWSRETLSRACAWCGDGKGSTKNGEKMRFFNVGIKVFWCVLMRRVGGAGWCMKNVREVKCDKYESSWIFRGRSGHPPKHRPCNDLGVGRLDSSKRSWFSGSMLVGGDQTSNLVCLWCVNVYVRWLDW